MAGDRAAVYGDAGFVDDDSAEDIAAMVGVGGRILLYGVDKIRISAVAAYHYVPGFDTEPEDDIDPDFGNQTISGEISYWEGSAGVLVSGDVNIDTKSKFVPYGGLLLSTLRGTVDADVDFPDVDVHGSSSTDFEEDTLPVAVVGGSLVLDQKITVRAEGRLIGDESFSLALGVAL
jgi:hypothetical protein